MPALPLPAKVEDKLDLLSGTVRRLRVLRGISWYLAIALISPVILIAGDTIFGLSGFTRGTLTVLWFSAMIAGLWWFILRRMFGEIPPQMLAEAIEARYPSLAERLSTLVELSRGVDSSSGSAAMMNLLGHDTERRIERLNLSEVVARKQSVRLAIIAFAAVAVSIVPLFFVSGTGDRFKRFVKPFYVPSTEPTFRIVVSSGNPVVRRADRVTLSGYMERTKPSASLPDAMTLVYREIGSADEKKLPMTGDDKSSFAATRTRVQNGFEYCLESEGIRTGWHTVSVVDPVELAVSSTVTIQPPVYAAGKIPTVKRDAAAEITALQHSTATFRWEFTQPIRDGWLEWSKFDSRPNAPGERLSWRVSEDRLSATATFPLMADGTLRVILLGDKDFRTEIPVAVRVRTDAPPAWEYILGLPDPNGGVRDVRPSEPLRISLAVKDDIAVSAVWIDYGFNNANDIQSERLSINGINTTRAEGTITVPWAGRFKEGDLVRIRLRASDNRSVPEYRLNPQEIAYPEGWIAFRMNSKAIPLDEQDAIAQHERFARRVAELKTKIETAIREIAVVRAEAVEQPRLAPEHAIRIRNAREELKGASDVTSETVKENAMVVPMQSLVARLKEIDGTFTKKADVKLKSIPDQSTLARREELAKASQTELNSALEKLTELEKQNASLASDRLDAIRLNRLGNEQSALAERARNARDSKESQALEDEQDLLKKKLKETIQKSERLRDSFDEAKRDENDYLARKLKNLKESLDKLNDDATTANRQARAERLEAVAHKQKELADQLQRLTRDSATASRLTDTSSEAKTPAGNASDLIKEKPESALTEQTKSALELEKKAEALDKAVRERRETREAAKQIARWQDDLRQRYADAVRQNPDKLPETLKKKFDDEQSAISRAIDRLSLPPDDELKKIRRETSDRANMATKDESASANQNAMQQTIDALERLAGMVPANEARLRATVPELEKLRREQESIQRDIDDALSQPNDDLGKKLVRAAQKQDELIKKLSKLDLPGLEDRLESMLEKQKRATDDLNEVRVEDIPASQREAKRQLDRLNDELARRTPPDREAAELAQLQERITERLTGLERFQPDELQRLQRQTKDVQERLSKLQNAGDANEKLKQFDDELRKPKPDVDELKKKSQAAAGELQKLKRRLADDEHPEDRLDRLARQREQQAQSATKNADKPADPVRAQDALRQLDKDLDELSNLRLGGQQGKRKELKDVLEKLKKTPNPDKASDLQEQSAKLARELADEFRANAPERQEKPPFQEPDVADARDSANGLPTRKHAEEFRRLARSQRELSGELSRAIDPTTKPRSPEELGKLAEQHQRAAAQTGELERELEQHSQSTGSARLRETSEELGKARTQLEGAERLTRQGKTDEADKMRAAAMNRLKAAVDVSGWKLSDLPKPNPNANREAGLHLRDADKKMNKAANDKNERATILQDAGASLRKAADSIQRGSSGATAGEPGEVESSRDPGFNEPDIVQKNIGKPWGELPGEIRNQITQELKAKYGDDYARIIKLYFEQLADRK